MTTRYTEQSPDIIWQRLGEDIVAIKGDDLATHILNETAAFIWERCDGNRGIEEITSEVCANYEVSPDVARVDVIEIVKALEYKGMVCYLSSKGR